LPAQFVSGACVQLVLEHTYTVLSEMVPAFTVCGQQ
jgi:hypothetical protein